MFNMIILQGLGGGWGWGVSAPTIRFEKVISGVQYLFRTLWDSLVHPWDTLRHYWRFWDTLGYYGIL